MKRQEIAEELCMPVGGHLGQLGPSGASDKMIAVTLCTGFATAPAIMLVESMIHYQTRAARVHHY